MSKAYEPPALRDIGTLEQLTEQRYNKIGPSPDMVTSVNPDVIGSYVPVP